MIWAQPFLVMNPACERCLVVYGLPCRTGFNKFEQMLDSGDVAREGCGDERRDALFRVRTSMLMVASSRLSWLAIRVQLG